MSLISRPLAASVSLIAMLMLSGCVSGAIGDLPVKEPVEAGSEADVQPSDDDVPETDPDDAHDTDDDSPSTPTPDSAQGTRQNPLPLGAEVSGTEWTVVINSVTFDADDVVAAENPYNDPAGEGKEYALVNFTVIYNGDDPNGQVPFFGPQVAYVTPEGREIYGYDQVAVVPDGINDLGTLYSGASASGNLGFAIPSEGATDGVISVRTDDDGDTVFVAVQ